MPASPRRRWLRFTPRALIAIGVVLVCATVLLVTSARFQIGYHKWAMQRAWDAIYAQPDTITNGLAGYSLDEDYDRYVHHRQRLVDFGALDERSYAFNHIRAPTDESKHLFNKMTAKQCPAAIDCEGNHPNSPELMQLTVWCYPEDAESWDEFVAKHDVPDYRTRFIEAPAPLQ